MNAYPGPVPPPEPPPEPPSTADVVVVGGGLIGLASAWRIAQRGLSVVVCDPAPGARTSSVAAGMLAPVTEATYGEEPLLRLGLASAAAWPGFAAELGEVTGLDAGLYETGTLAVAYDTDDGAVLRRLAEFQRTLGLEVDDLTSREVRRREPMLAVGVAGGLWVAGDHSVDNRLAVAAVLAAAPAAGVRLVRDRAAVRVTGSRVTGVDLAGGGAISAGTVVVAAGPWSAQVEGIPEGLRPPIRPVKGEILRLRVPPEYRPLLSHTVRATARGFAVYMVPRPGGELVVGATSSELGFDTRVLAGGVHALLRDARTVLPVIDELELVETTAGLRPTTPDNAPVIGPAKIEGLVWATGHYRNGVLLTPITAEIVAATVTTGLPAIAEPFAAERFDPGTVAS